MIKMNDIGKTRILDMEIKSYTKSVITTEYMVRENYWSKPVKKTKTSCYLYITEVGQINTCYGIIANNTMSLKYNTEAELDLDVELLDKAYGKTL